MEKESRRSFLEIGTAFIGGVLGLAAGIPLIGFAISPAFKKGESKWLTWVSPTDSKTVALKR